MHVSISQFSRAIKFQNLNVDRLRLNNITVEYIFLSMKKLLIVGYQNLVTEAHLFPIPDVSYSQKNSVRSKS